MTVSTTTNKIIIAGDGANTTFTFPFAMPATAAQQAAAIQVYFTDAAGTISLISSTLYTLVVNAAVNPNPTPVGGTVTYPLTGSPIALGTTLTILRTLPLTQPTSLANQGALYQPTLESMDDQQTMELQQLQELLNRQITVAVSDPTPSALPPAAQRANLAMGFDASGNPTAIATLPAGTVSSAMAPFVASASIAAAKALLGYGTMANENIGAAGKGIADDGAGNARVNQTLTAVATNQSPAAAQHMTNYVSTGALLFTLPKQTTVFNGYELWIFCVSGTAVLSPNAADNFPGAAGGASITLTVGQAARLIGDGVSSWQIFIGRIPGIGSSQTRQSLTSGTGATYTTPVGCRRIIVRESGAGGGGGGNGTASATNGGTGGTTTFNSVNAVGGTGGTATNGAVTAGGGGAGGTGGTGTADLRRPGNAGGGGLVAGAVNQAVTGGFGGAGFFGGGAAVAKQDSGTSAGGAGGANTGAGGAGAGNSNASNFGSSGGGGAGEYVELVINNPASSYTYTVGAAGTAGAAGTSGAAGGAGGSGIIIVDEYY